MDEIRDAPVKEQIGLRGKLFVAIPEQNAHGDTGERTNFITYIAGGPVSSIQRQLRFLQKTAMSCKGCGQRRQIAALKGWTVGRCVFQLGKGNEFTGQARPILCIPK